MLTPRPFLLAAAFVVLSTAPALAEESGTSDFFGALGDFVKSGLSAPRTAEDLEREGKTPAAGKAVEKLPASVETPATPAPEPGRMVVAPPAPEPPPAAEAPPPVTIATPAPAPAPLPVAPPPPARPKPVTLPAQPAPEPIAPSDRIAGTASLDQAVKLGGSREFYGRALRRPAKD